MARTNLDRRSFLKAAGGLGALSIAGVGIAGQVPKAQAEETAFPEQQNGQPLEATVDPVTGKLEVNEDVIVRYSACLGCYSSCGNRLKLDRAIGSPHLGGRKPLSPELRIPVLELRRAA
ncbi:MAG: twin-arginine translocation signal domain-containing protein [Gordonibacter pamelaeae]